MTMWQTMYLRRLQYQVKQGVEPDPQHQQPQHPEVEIIKEDLVADRPRVDESLNHHQEENRSHLRAMESPEEDPRARAMLQNAKNTHQPTLRIVEMKSPRSGVTTTLRMVRRWCTSVELLPIINRVSSKRPTHGALTPTVPWIRWRRAMQSSTDDPKRSRAPPSVRKRGRK